MSISTFLQTHKELDKIKKEFKTLKSYNSRFQTILKLRPESFSGLSADQLEKTWIKRHTKKCISMAHTRDWLTFKLTNLKEIENLKKEKRKRKRKEKGKGRDDKEKEKRKCKRAQARKKRRKRKYQLEMSDLGNENLLVTDLQANDHSTQNDKNQKKTKMKSNNEHYNKRKCKLGHFRNRSRNDTCHKKPKLKLKLKSELTSKCKRKLKLKTPILIAKEKNTQSNDSKIKNFRNRKELNLLDLKEKKIKNEYFETNTTTPLKKVTNNYFQTNNQNQNENEYGYEHEYEYEHDHKQDHEQDHEQEENGLMKLEDNNQILDSENFDIYTYDDSNSSSSLGDIFGFSYDENENENQTLNKDNNKFDQIYIIETEQSLNDGELAADIEFINSQEEDIVLSEKDLKFLRNDLSIEKQMNEKFDIFFQNDDSFLLLNEPNDPLEC